MRYFNFKSNQITYNLVDPTPSEVSGPLLLLLHGGNKEVGKDRFCYLQSELAKSHISSLAFDFPGIGDSPGIMRETSLASRTQITLAVVDEIKKLYPKKEFSLYGVSMGGYIALNVVSKLPNVFTKLVLHAPAAYAEAAYELPFDLSFTNVLRQEESWADSASFDWLQEYPGAILFLIGEEDTVIPKEITDTYKKILDSKDNSTFISVPNMEHDVWLGADTQENPKEIVTREMVIFLQKNKSNDDHPIEG